MDPRRPAFPRVAKSYLYLVISTSVTRRENNRKQWPVRLSQESQKILLRAKTNSNASVFSSASVKLSTSVETDADHASKEDGAEEASMLSIQYSCPPTGGWYHAMLSIAWYHPPVGGQKSFPENTPGCAYMNTRRESCGW
eukprot:g11517.t1